MTTETQTTEPDAESLDGTVADLEDEREDLEARESRLAEEMAELRSIAPNTDRAEEVRDDLREVRARLEELEAVEPKLRARLEEARRRELLAEAQKADRELAEAEAGTREEAQAAGQRAIEALELGLRLLDRHLDAQGELAAIVADRRRLADTFRECPGPASEEVPRVDHETLIEAKRSLQRLAGEVERTRRTRPADRDSPVPGLLERAERLADGEEAS